MVVYLNAIIDSEKLSEHHHKLSPLRIASHKIQRSVVPPHDLARETETYARTVTLGCKERDEYLLLSLRGDRSTVIGNLDDSALGRVDTGRDADVFRTSLDGILDEVDEYAADLRLVGIYQYIFG